MLTFFKRYVLCKKIPGFTIVELLIAIAILAILTSAILATLDPLSQLQKGQDTKRKSDLSEIQRALEAFYQDNGRYPYNAVNCQFEIQGNNSDSDDCISWGQTWTPYMTKVPKENSKVRSYRYYASSNGQTYYLFASLERGSKDPHVCNGGAACVNAAAQNITCGTSNQVCNYGVSSSNTTP